MLEFLLTLLYEILTDLLVFGLVFAVEDVLLALEAVAEWMLTSRHEIVEDAAEAEDVDLIGAVRVLVSVLLLVEDDLGRLPADTTLHRIRVVTVHLRL